MVVAGLRTMTNSISAISFSISAISAVTKIVLLINVLTLLNVINVVVQARVYVVLTFDDGLIEHYEAARMLKRYGLPASFYINSGTIGATGRMVWNQVREIDSMGHEIGGHTISHANLAILNETERLEEIFQDYAVTSNEIGKPLKTFVYPFGVNFPNEDAVLQQAGYKYARDSGGLATPTSCVGCPSAVGLPVTDFYGIRSISNRNTMDPGFFVNQVRAAVRDFTQRDAMLPFIFHEIRDVSPPDQGITWMNFELLVAWLSANPNITVATLINAADRRATTSSGSTSGSTTSTTSSSTTSGTSTTTSGGTSSTSSANGTDVSQNNDSTLLNAVILEGVFLGVFGIALIVIFVHKMRTWYFDRNNGNNGNKGDKSNALDTISQSGISPDNELMDEIDPLGVDDMEKEFESNFVAIALNAPETFVTETVIPVTLTPNAAVSINENEESENVQLNAIMDIVQPSDDVKLNDDVQLNDKDIEELPLAELGPEFRSLTIDDETTVVTDTTEIELLEAQIVGEIVDP